MQVRPEWSQPQRQPGAAILIVLHKVILELFKRLWPLLLVWFFRSKSNNGSNLDMIILGISVIIFILSLLEYWFFRFSIPAEELVIRKGLLVKRTIILPLHKIQSVHIDQNWLHRLLNLSQVSFDSPGSKNTEAKITMHKQQALEFRDFILGSGAGMESKEFSVTPPFYTMEPYDLFRLGLSANHLEAFFILLAFGISVMDDIQPVIGNRFDGAIEWFSEQAATQAFSAILVLAVVLLVISVAASFTRIILKYANFSISNAGKGFQIKGGLINSKEKLVPFKKIQFISWKANWIRKQIPYYLLQFHSAGHEETRRKWEINVPVTRSSLIPVLLEHYHALLPDDVPAIRMHREFVFRRTLFAGIIPACVLALSLSTMFGWSALWFFLLAPYMLLTSWLFQRNFRLRLSKEAVQVHHAVFGKKVSILLWHKIQSVKLRQSIYQRRKSLATVHLYTAGGVIRVPFITLQQAQQLRDYALFKIESERRNWM
ncbi:MAG TPA: PH domain-containing protein [Chitinophagaceae bacterium]